MKDFVTGDKECLLYHASENCPPVWSQRSLKQVFLDAFEGFTSSTKERELTLFDGEGEVVKDVINEALNGDEGLGRCCCKKDSFICLFNSPSLLICKSWSSEKTTLNIRFTSEQFFSVPLKSAACCRSFTSIQRNMKRSSPCLGTQFKS